MGKPNPCNVPPKPPYLAWTNTTAVTTTQPPVVTYYFVIPVSGTPCPQ